MNPLSLEIMLFLKKLFAKDGIDGRETTLEAPCFFDEARNNIYPWIKVTYPFTRENCRTSVRQLFEGQNMPVFQFWQEDLCIFYAVERGNCYEFLLQKDVPRGISHENLHQMAARNLNRDIHFELQAASFGGYVLAGGGDHASASICLPHVWESICKELKDNLIIGVPTQNQVYIVPEKDTNNVSNMKIQIHELFKREDQLLTRNIFRLDGSNMEWSLEDTVGK
jgi:hypothetical protein